MVQLFSLCLHLLLFISAEVLQRNVVDGQRLYGLAPEGGSASLVGGVVTLTDSQTGYIRLFGVGLTSHSRVKLTKNDSTCEAALSLKLGETELSNTTAILQVKEDEVMIGAYYVCLSNSTADVDNAGFNHQGTEKWLRVEIVPDQSTDLLPLEVQILFIVVCIILSGVFSGLNLGLMALDPTELKVVMRSGSKKEKTYAGRIEPVRRHGNYLLCTLLLGNVLVNSTFTILLDNLTGSGLLAVVCSTAGIVVFGEIIPQSICSRYGLAIGSYTVWLTWAFMIITFPVSFPISRILDFILGDEIGRVYTRTQLLELVRVTGEHMDLVENEVGMLSGVLGFKEKTVCDVMTKLDDAYLLNINSVLDFQTISDILQHGHSRIPVYEEERSRIIGLLFARDLSLLDPDDRIPLKTIMKYYHHELLRVPFDTPLDKMLDEFKRGRGHMAVVQDVNDSTDGDPFYETLGIVTLEDIIEEIIQFEIVDESDIILDNRTRQPVGREPMDLSHFRNLNSDAGHGVMLSSQLSLAVFQFLTAEIQVFSEEVISGNVLRRLINKPGIAEDICLSDRDSTAKFIYRKSHTANYFILLLQGRAKVVIGSENLQFDAGPFSYFGVQALTPMYESWLAYSKPSPKTPSPAGRPQGYCPDFSLEIVSDVQLLRVTRAQYLAALRVTEFETKVKDETEQEKFFQKEMAQAEARQSDEVSRTSSQRSKGLRRKRAVIPVEETASSVEETASSDDEMSDENVCDFLSTKPGRVHFAPNGGVDVIVNEERQNFGDGETAL